MKQLFALRKYCFGYKKAFSDTSENALHENGVLLFAFFMAQAQKRILYL